MRGALATIHQNVAIKISLINDRREAIQVYFIDFLWVQGREKKNLSQKRLIEAKLWNAFNGLFILEIKVQMYSSNIDFLAISF